MKSRVRRITVKKKITFARKAADAGQRRLRNFIANFEVGCCLF